MEVRRVIAGFGEGDRSRDAVRFAAVVAAATGAELIVAHVASGDHERGLAQAERALPYGSRAALVAVEAGSAVQGLHDLAEREDADLIVVGATTRGSLELHAIGSVPERLLRGAPCAVAVAPRNFASETDPALRVIGVAYDGSSEADQALAAGARLALRSGATLKLIGVADRVRPSLNRALRSRLDDVANVLPDELQAEAVFATGVASEAILANSDQLSLLVMGSRGYGPARRALLGSVAAPVLRAANCPVAVVPRAGEISELAREFRVFALER